MDVKYNSVFKLKLYIKPPERNIGTSHNQIRWENLIEHKKSAFSRLILTKDDILEIKPKVPYSSDYQSVVNEYQNNENEKLMPEIEDIGINLDDYDEIIIGSPVWWYTITPSIRTFLKENNLSGKRVIPFATNAGWLGRTLKK